MHPLIRWMNKATAPQKRALATLAGTSVATLRQIAGGYRTKGKPHASPELARRIEIGTVKLAPVHKLPVVLRTDLCPACSVCEFAKQCKE